MPVRLLGWSAYSVSAQAESRRARQASKQIRLTSRPRPPEGVGFRPCFPKLESIIAGKLLLDQRPSRPAGRSYRLYLPLDPAACAKILCHHWRRERRLTCTDEYPNRFAG